jgi:hypothetical protein
MQQNKNNMIGINDVLLGRGGATTGHEGNKRYRAIVSHHLQEYLAARKREKALIAQKIVAIVKENGGRFLKRDPNNVWLAVSDQRAREKTSQALREGLDVRNNTVRPNYISRSGNSEPKNKPQVVVPGWVKPPAPAPARDSSSALKCVSGVLLPDPREEQASMLSRSLPGTRRPQQPVLLQRPLSERPEWFSAESVARQSGMLHPFHPNALPYRTVIVHVPVPVALIMSPYRTEALFPIYESTQP